MISAIICTRDRPEPLVRAIRSLLAGNTVPFELIVVDQSEGTESPSAVTRFMSDARFRYIQTAPLGAGAALNEGLRRAQGSILVCMDDDCEAPPGWLTDMARVLEGQPTAAAVFCNVVAPEHDRNSGYVPAYVRRSNRLVRSIAATCLGHGMSAGMAVRCHVIRAIGGFDDSLGPGARFPAADDWDIAFRVLRRGWHVYETSEISIVHHGFRTFEEGRDHARRDWLGIGAVCAKLIRAGGFGAISVALWEFTAHALWPPLADLLRLRRPRGFTRIAGFLRGFWQGLRIPLNRASFCFSMQGDERQHPTINKPGRPRTLVTRGLTETKVQGVRGLNISD